jgi:hypothetical protein
VPKYLFLSFSAFYTPFTPQSDPMTKQVLDIAVTNGQKRKYSANHRQDRTQEMERLRGEFEALKGETRGSDLKPSLLLASPM